MAYKTVDVTGGNLYQIALRYLGDATQWNRIAELNGTGTDPILPTGVRLKLSVPPVNSDLSGGVYNPPRNTNPHRDTILTGADGAILTGADGAAFRGTP